jgi:hypothetical protein
LWIISNGAHKTGSTWVHRLLRQTGKLEAVPAEYRDAAWQNSSVSVSEIRAAATVLGPTDTFYGSKQHFSHSSGILDIHGIKVVNSIRDLRDTIVSKYYHDVRVLGETQPLDAYLEAYAEKFVRQFCAYQQYWIDAPEKHAWNYHITSYEYLSEDPFKACREMFSFCGFFLNRDEIEKIVDQSSFERMDSGPGKFFRKGKVHAFADDLSATQIDRLMNMAERAGLREIKNRIAAFNTALKPYLEKTDVGL